MTGLSTEASVRFGPDDRPSVDAIVRLTSASYIYCHIYDDSSPILSVTDEHVHVAFNVPEPKQVTGEDVTAARRLAAAVTRWVAELEQLAAATGLTEPVSKDAAERAA
jgi:hypothetical protein